MAKLVLELDIAPDLIERVTSAAKAQKESLAKFTERLYENVKAPAQLIENKPFRMKSEDELSDRVKGLIAVDAPVADFDHKAEYGKHLEEKYGK